MAPLAVSVPDQPGWAGVSASPLHALWRSTDEQLAAAVRTAARTGDLEEVLDALSSAGVRRTPDFVAVLEGDPLRVVTRGVAYAVGFGPAGPVEFRAGGRGPWDDDDSPQAVERIELRPGAMVADAGVADAAAPSSGPAAPAVAPVSASPVPAPPAPAPAAEPESLRTPEPEPEPASGDEVATRQPALEPANPQPATRPTSSAWRAPALFSRERRRPAGDEPAHPDPRPELRPEPAAQPEPPAGPEEDAGPEPAAGSQLRPAQPRRQPTARTDEPVQQNANGEQGESAAAAEVEDLPSYDHLFGATEHVRPQPRMIDPHDTQGLSEPAIGHTHHESAGGFVPAPAEGSGGLTLPPPSDTERPAPPPTPPTPPTPPSSAPKATQDDRPAADRPATGAKGALIDSVPWRSGGSTVPPPAVAPEPAPPAGASQAPERPDPPPARPAAPGALAPSAPAPTAPSPTAPSPVAPAPTPAPTSTPARPTPALPVPAPPTSTPTASTPPTAGPVDDEAEATVDRSALLAAQGAGSAHAGPTVLAVLCPAGHTSPPHAGTCRVCQRTIPQQQPFQTPRPALGTLRLSTGDVVTLDRGVLLGRSPKLNADLPPGERPHLVRVPSPENDISRNHVEVVLEGWHVLVRDLGSTNGTTVTLPGQPPVRLRPGDSQVIEPGTVVTLADEVSLTFEVAPS